MKSVKCLSGFKNFLNSTVICGVAAACDFKGETVPVVINFVGDTDSATTDGMSFEQHGQITDRCAEHYRSTGSTRNGANPLVLDIIDLLKENNRLEQVNSELQADLWTAREAIK